MLFSLPRFHLSTALALMLATAFLLYANLNPHRFPRVQEVRTETLLDSASRNPGHVLECRLRIEHGWPFKYHTIEYWIDERTLVDAPYDAAKDAEYLADFPRSSNERQRSGLSGFEGGWGEFGFSRNDNMEIVSPRAGNMPYYIDGYHSWNSFNLLKNVLLAIAVLAAVGIVLEKFILKDRDRASNKGTIGTEGT